jgi:hypothetical protein
MRYRPVTKLELLFFGSTILVEMLLLAAVFRVLGGWS